MKLKKYYSIIIPLFFFTISFILLGRHEMWRDEIQHWLLARDSTNILTLIENLKYEGSPGLWHFILFLITRIFNDPYYMQVLHVLISSSTIFIIFKYSPFNKIQKILLTFNYFLFFEYSLIARSYVISVFLVFIYCALFKKKENNSIKIALVLFLLSNSGIFGLILAVCLFGTTILESLLRVYKKKYKLRDFIRKESFSIFIIFSGFLSSLLQLFYNLPKDVIYKNLSLTLPSINKILLFLKYILRAYIPIPDFNLSNWWGSSILKDNNLLAFLSIIFLMLVISIFINYLFKRPSALFLYLSISFILSLFFLLKFSGSSLRHHGLIFIGLIASLWIYNYCLDFNKNKKIKFGSKALTFATTSIFSLQAFAGISAASLDYMLPFSSAKETADFINKIDLSKYEIISHGDAQGSAILGYIKNKKAFYYLTTGKKGSFIKWNELRAKNNEIIAQRNEDINNKILQNIVEEIIANDKQVILVLNTPLKELTSSNENFREVFVSQKSTVKDETFYVYLYQ